MKSQENQEFSIGDLYYYSHKDCVGLLFYDLQDPLLKLKNNDFVIVLAKILPQLKNKRISYQHFVLSKYGIKKIYDSDLKKFCKKIRI